MKPPPNTRDFFGTTHFDLVLFLSSKKFDGTRLHENGGEKKA